MTVGETTGFVFVYERAQGDKSNGDRRKVYHVQKCRVGRDFKREIRNLLRERKRREDRNVHHVPQPPGEMVTITEIIKAVPVGQKILSKPHPVEEGITKLTSAGKRKVARAHPEASPVALRVVANMPLFASNAVRRGDYSQAEFAAEVFKRDAQKRLREEIKRKLLAAGVDAARLGGSSGAGPGVRMV
jgi:hypothetical protein